MIVVKMKHIRSTKNTHVYDAVTTGRPPEVKTLYIEKWAVDEPPPLEIAITIASGAELTTAAPTTQTK